jgi:hypothetical protein
MVTGMLAVKNLTAGEHHDLWSVNTDQEYHEEIVVEAAIAGAFAEAFAKIDRLAFGLSTGTVAGLLLFVATLALVLKGGDVVGPNLQLLRNYFPGYTVTLSGSLLALLYGFLVGFTTGWGFAFLRNLSVFLYTALIQQRAERLLLRKLLEYI